MNDMSRDEEVMRLLMAWEDSNNRGEGVDLEHLCREHPALLAEVRGKVAALRSINQRIETADDDSDTGSSNGPVTPALLEFLGTQSVRILKNHAQGGLGEVFLAEDTQLGRRVALKVIQATHDHDDRRRKRFVREAELTGRLEHPGVVPVYGLGVDGSGRTCYTMRFIDGETLQQEIARFHGGSARPIRDNPREFRQLLNSFVAVCKTVGYAHSKSIIHRDIKPANIIVGRFGETLLVDWGLAKQLSIEPTNSTIENEDDQRSLLSNTMGSPSQPIGDPADPLTQNNLVMGTPGYISPEQAGSTEPVGTASDIWSLGATLFAILTGRPPIQSNDLGAILQDARKGAVPIPSRLNSAVPRPLEAVCLKALASQPDRRYESALALASEIEQWLAGEPVQAYPEPPAARISRWVFQHRTWVTSATVALVVATFLLAILVASMSEANKQLQASYASESIERERATRNEKLAEGQSELALATLQSVIRDLQVQLKNVPAAHAVRKSMLDKAVEGLKKVSANLKQQPDVNHNLVRAHLELGDLFFEIGDESGNERTETAREHFETALSIATILAKNPDDLEAKRELAFVHRRLGKISERLATLSEVKKHYQRAFELWTEIDADGLATDNDTRLRAVACDDLGEIASDNSELDEANQWYQMALDIRQQRLDEVPEFDEWVRDLQVSHDKLGGLALRTAKSAEAIEHFRQALKINEQRIQKSPTDGQTQRDLAYAHRQVGYGLFKAGRYAEAEPEYAESLRLYSTYYELDPTNVAAERDLCTIQQRMGDLMLKLAGTEQAKVHYEQMYRHCEQLVAVDVNNQIALRDLSIACGKRADVLEAEGNGIAAIEFRNRNLEIARKLETLDPDNPRSRALVASALSQLASTLLESGQAEQARPLLSEAVAISRSVWQANPADKKNWRQFLVLEMQWGVALKRTKYFDEARAAYADARKLTESFIATDSDNASIQLDLVTICYAQGILEFEADQFDAAQSAYQTALKVIIELEERNLLVGDDLTWRSTLVEALEQVASAGK